MKLIKITIAFSILVSLQIAAAQWLHVPPLVEARNLMVIGGGVPVVAGCAASYFEDTFTRENSGSIGGTWTETDSASLLAISSNSMVFTHSASTVGYGLQTLGSTSTEGYLQFKISWSNIAMGGSGEYMNVIVARDGGDDAAIVIQPVIASTNVRDITVRHYNDAGASTEVGTYNLSPSNSTVYTMKLYYKRATDVATSNGIIKLSIDGTERISSTTLDFYTYADIKYIRFGNAGSTYASTAGYTITFDDFEWRADDCFD